MAVRGKLHLTINDNEGVFPLETPRFSIGRGSDNALCLPDPQVSRYHAEVVRLGNDFLLRDLGSTNGSFVNGVRVSEQLLNDGDVLQFGNSGSKVIFERVEEAGQQAEPERHDLSTTNKLIDTLSEKLEGTTTDAREEVNIRCVLAEAHLNKGEPEAARDKLAKYTDPARLRELPVQFRATVLFWLGRVQVESKEYTLAVETLGRSVNLFTEAGDDTGQAGAYAQLGRALIGTGELLAARDNLHRAMLTARQAGNQRLRTDVHLLLGKVDWKEGDFEGARYNWTRAVRLAEGSNDALLQARAQLQLAFVLYSEGNLAEAVPAYQSAIDQIEAIGNVRFLLKAYSNMSRALTRLGSWGATERLLEDRLRIARDNHLAKAEAVALTDLAELRLLQGNFTAAKNVIESALERHGETVYARTQRILGRVLLAHGQPHEAIQALEKGLAAARKKGALEEQVLIGLELALIYLEVKDTSRAREQLEAAESITSLDPALVLMARALYTRGCIHVALGQTAEANRTFTQSLSLFQTIGDPYRTGLCHAAMGSLRLLMGRPGSSRAHLEEAAQIFSRLGAAYELKEVEKRLASRTYDKVEATMTRTLSAGLTLTAPLSLTNIQTMRLDAKTDEPVPQRILVAEANDELASLLTKGLEVENYVVDRIQDGRAALELAIKPGSSYDLLLLDALLEHRSGFDVCRELRKRNLEMPIILLGGRQGVEDKIEALQAGADDFIAKKNMVFEELLAKMEALLR